LCDNALLLGLLIASLLTVVSGPQAYPDEGERNFDLSFENEISLEPSNSELISDYDSELDLLYEFDVLEFETIAEFDKEGLSDAELLLGAEKGDLRAEFEMVFDPEESTLASYRFAGKMEPNQETCLELEYEYEYSGGEGPGKGALVLALDRDLPGGIALDLEGKFEETNYRLEPVPERTEIGLKKLIFAGFECSADLELENHEPTELEIEFESSESQFSKTGFTFEGAIVRDNSKTLVELEPEVDSNLGNLYFKSVIRLSGLARAKGLKLVEAGLTDLTPAGFELELSRDFDYGETEITLKKEEDSAEAEFELETRSGAKDQLFSLDRITGELSWRPTELITVAVETELEPTSLSEINFTSKYEF